MQLVITERPEVAEGDARVIVHAVFTAVNDLARIEHLRERPHLSDDLLEVARAILLATQ
ncbi:hypothetical protein [Nonomuraea sp. LPB2021202275-12-8]|uniref:hypothetical protein n=1 Tax=Nonomuraea sp. LPB2021202275-12-8 TaxID=3120159 RepID=UPI00300C4955